MKLKDAILFVYTLILFVLHLYALGHVLYSASEFVYSNVVWFLIFITALQYLDIIFSFFLTKSNPIVVFVQVSGRILVLYVANHTTGWMPVVFCLVAVYLLSELCRGPYYLTQCLKVPNDQLTWLRYNAFKVLYPIGFTCEGLVFANVFLNSHPPVVDIMNPYFILTLFFPIIFLTIVKFLYSSMSKKAAQKNKELKKKN